MPLKSQHCVQTSAPASARIYVFPACLSEPIDQRGRRGRFPKGVGSLTHRRHLKVIDEAKAAFLKDQIKDLDYSIARHVGNQVGLEILRSEKIKQLRTLEKKIDRGSIPSNQVRFSSGD